MNACLIRFTAVVLGTAILFAGCANIADVVTSRFTTIRRSPLNRTRRWYPGADKESNWLPAPDGPIYLVMRLYWPKEQHDFQTVDPSDTAARGRGEASETLVLILSEHLATERQRQVAEERARRAYQALRANQSLSDHQRIPFRKTRYIAVNTERDWYSDGDASVMIYDTQKHLLRDTVSDLSQTARINPGNTEGLSWIRKLGVIQLM